jgi:hypothetical protein
VLDGILFLYFQFSFAQKKEQIGTETVNVLNHTHQNSMLLNQKTELDDEETAQKKRLSIPFSLSCSFYFTPSKGKAEGVEKEKQAILFKKLRHIWGGELWNFHWGVICKSYQ